MTNPGNWPDPERHGVPMFPEQDGWHWIDTGLASGMRPLFWQSKSKSWFASADTCANRWKHTDSWKYHGPCLTPAQISDMLAAERERSAKACDAERIPDFSMPEQWHNNGCKHCAAAIRTLGAEL